MITAPKGWNFSKDSPGLLTWPLAFFWPVKDLIHFDERVDESNSRKSLTKTVKLSVFLSTSVLMNQEVQLAKKNSVFFTPHSLVRTLVSLVNELYCQLGDKRLPYHLLQEPNKKSLMVCQNSGPNSWSHSWHECPQSAVCCRSLIPLPTCRRKERWFFERL